MKKYIFIFVLISSFLSPAFSYASSGSFSLSLDVSEPDTGNVYLPVNYANAYPGDEVDVRLTTSWTPTDSQPTIQTIIQGDSCPPGVTCIMQPLSDPGFPEQIHWTMNRGITYQPYVAFQVSPTAPGGMYHITFSVQEDPASCNLPGFTCVPPQQITISFVIHNCPTASVALSDNPINVGDSTTASAPGGWGGGNFTSDNPAVASVSGVGPSVTVTGNGSGTANISGSGWINTYGTNCPLNPVALTVNSIDTGICGSANKTYPLGATSYGSDTYCSVGTPSVTPPFPSPGTNATWICNGRNGGGDSPVCTASVPADHYSITVMKTIGGWVTSDDGTISCGMNCSGNYPANSVITLTAHSDFSSWKFIGWGGDCVGTGTCDVNVSNPKNVWAKFLPIPINDGEF